MFPRRNHPITYQGGHFTLRPLVPREKGAFQSARDRCEERMKRDRFNFRASNPTGCDKLPQRARNTTPHLDGVTPDVERNTWDFRFHCEPEVRNLIAKKRHQFVVAVGEHFARLQANNILLPDGNMESCDLPWVRFPNELPAPSSIRRKTLRHGTRLVGLIYICRRTAIRRLIVRYCTSATNSGSSIRYRGKLCYVSPIHQ